MKRKVAILTEKKKFQLVEETIPELQDHEILIKVSAIGLCHTDMPTYLGDSAMGFDAYGHFTMVKDVQFPAEVGHEAVGVVEAVGAGVTNFKVGDYVGGTPLTPGFASYIVAPAAFCVLIPKEVPFEELKYCLAEPLMCVANIVQAANPRLGDNVAIVGCGMMGLLIMAGLSHSGARKIIAIDVEPSRLELAKKFGATDCINPAKDDLTAEVNRLTNNEGADIVVEITGSLRGLKTAVKTVYYGAPLGSAKRGKILIPSLYSREEKWDPEIGYELMFRSPIIHSTHPTYTQDYMEAAQVGVEAYAKGILPLKKLISHEFSLEEIQKGFELMESRDLSYIKGIIIP
ncbi:MAG: zinc-binding dehydrogenase [Lachnospiraceae bacterium]